MAHVEDIIKSQSLPLFRAFQLLLQNREEDGGVFKSQSLPLFRAFQQYFIKATNII